jgi:hypothetical protein
MTDLDPLDREPVIPAENDLHKLAMQIRYDLTAAQGKLTELVRQIGWLEIENRPTANINGSVAYTPGRLRYLAGARVALQADDGDELTPAQRARVYLEGFTDNEAEIREHLAVLAVVDIDESEETP